MGNSTIRPTLGNQPTSMGKKYELNFNKNLNTDHVKLNETDRILDEAEKSLKKKIFSLSKMESLVFSDPKLSAIYEEMAENGSEKYGYHFNETVLNIIFNEYVLNSPKYLQKYKQAIPVKKKRRDQSGINQLKKAGEEKMQTRNLKPKATNVNEENLEGKTQVLFLINETDPNNPDLFAYFPNEDYNDQYKSGYSHVGQHTGISPEYAEESRQATPEEYLGLEKELKTLGYDLDVLNGIQEMTGSGGGGAMGGGSGQYSAPLGYKQVDETTTSASSGQYSGPGVWGSGDLMKTKGKANVKKVPMVAGGTIIQENRNYLIDPSGFEDFINSLNEEDLSYQTKLGDDYQKTHTGSNKGMGVSEIPQSTARAKKKEGIDNNTSLYVGQDVDKMSDEDVSILHNDMTQNHSYFPHPKNKNLPNDGISGKLKENRTEDDEQIINKTSAFTSNTVKGWDGKDTNVEMNTLKTGDPDKANLKTMEESKKIHEKAESAAQQRLFGMAHAVQKGELSPNKVGGAVKKIAKDVSPEDVKDFASTKTKNLPEKVKKVDEDAQSMIGDSQDTMANKPQSTGSQFSGLDMGMNAGGGLSEAESLLEEINNELNAFSIHHNKLKRMAEDRKPSALILKDRLGDENKANFKKDMKDSSVSDIVDIENELEYQDQQTEVGDNPYELGEKIEKTAIKSGDMKSGEALKNVGNSANDKGDEITKRNLTTEEQDEVNNYRLGLGDLVYDNKPDQRFEDRMKADMGDKLYKQRQDKLDFRAGAPMYNKDTTPTEKGIDKKQFDKEKTGWNERQGLKEGMVTAKYFDAIGKKRLVDFNLNEVREIKTIEAGLFELNLDGLGNMYTQTVRMNENVNRAMNENKFFTNGKNIFVMKNKVQNLSEGDKKIKPVMNEQMVKMNHLLGYKPETFTNNESNKKNRGF